MSGIQDGVNVLSLFDGASCGQVALLRSGFKINKYFASEIKKSSINVTQKNYPNTVQLGDVTKIKASDLPKIDIMIGGSPCQGFSFAGKQLNFDDPRSKLFFEYVRVLREVREINPNVIFILENVPMQKIYRDVITTILQVGPTFINSNKLSAQNRNRTYWTNIGEIFPPKDKGILLKDIVHEYNGEAYSKTYDIQSTSALSIDIDKYLVPFDKSLKIINGDIKKGKIGYFRTDSQANRVYSIHGKAVTLTGESGGGAAKMGQYLFGCITPDRIEKRQKGPRFNDGRKSFTLTAQDKHGILIDGYIRKLTPIECERLQALPDNYTQGVSDTQRYEMLGNGWTVDVICHILSHIDKGNPSPIISGLF